MDIKVSVICNVYNHAPYLRDTLEGFVMQKTDFPFEVLVHDDASTDNSAEIIRQYEEKYPEIIKPIYQTENQYTRGGRITVRFQVPRITGEYVAICEGDDYWTDPLKLQKQYDFMEANPEYSLCGCSVAWVDMRTGKQKTWLCRTDADRDVSLEEIILEKKCRFLQTASYFVKKQVFCDRPKWSYNFGVGDTPLLMHAALCGKVRMLADEMAVYRNHAVASWTSRIDKDPSKKVVAFERMIDGLCMFNEATQYQYDAVVSSRIGQLQYNIARIKRDLKAMRSGELREIYLSRSLSGRVMDIIACKAPAVQKLLLRLFR